jgi:WD40 repeat protein
VGVPTCISTSGNRFLAIGTSIGNVVIFEVGVKDFRTLSRADQNKYGQVTSISVSRDNCYLVTGYETGLVILWDLYNFKLVKTILLHKNRILKVLFCGENY